MDNFERILKSLLYAMLFLAILGWTIVIGGTIYIVLHFVMKFW